MTHMSRHLKNMKKTQCRIVYCNPLDRVRGGGAPILISSKNHIPMGHGGNGQIPQVVKPTEITYDTRGKKKIK